MKDKILNIIIAISLFLFFFILQMYFIMINVKVEKVTDTDIMLSVFWQSFCYEYVAEKENI